jgi:hypothetical protein
LIQYASTDINSIITSFYRMKKSEVHKKNSAEFRNSLTAPLVGGSSLYEVSSNNNNGHISGLGTPLVGKVASAQHQQGFADLNNSKAGLSTYLSSSMQLSKGKLRGLENFPGSNNSNLSLNGGFSMSNVFTDDSNMNSTEDNS